MSCGVGETWHGIGERNFCLYPQVKSRGTYITITRRDVSSMCCCISLELPLKFSLAWKLSVKCILEERITTLLALFYIIFCMLQNPSLKLRVLQTQRIVCVCNSDVGNLSISLHAPQTRGHADCQRPVSQSVHNLAGSRKRPRYVLQSHCDVLLICGLSRAQDCDSLDVHSGTMLQRRELRAQCRNLPPLPSVRWQCQQAQWCQSETRQHYGWGGRIIWSRYVLIGTELKTQPCLVLLVVLLCTSKPIDRMYVNSQRRYYFEFIPVRYMWRVVWR